MPPVEATPNSAPSFTVGNGRVYAGISSLGEHGAAAMSLKSMRVPRSSRRSRLPPARIVAVSIDLTGAASHDDDWLLETSTGPVISAALASGFAE